MARSLRILHLEDDPADAELVAATLAADGLLCDCVRASSRAQFMAAIDGEYDLILSDFSIPGFDGISAQSIARERRPELPFVFVSGTIGEEVAIERLKDGATDYVLKQRLARLPPAVRRALQEAQDRRQRLDAEAEVRHLTEQLERRVEERTAQLAEANTALLRRETELDDAKLFLEHLIAASPSIIFRLEIEDGDLVPTYVSPNIGWMLGYSVGEVVGATGFWLGILHPDDRDASLQSFRDAVDGTTAQLEQEYRFRAKDGRYRWFLANMRVDYDDGARPGGILCHALDITDRKRAEQALADNEERTRLILQTAHDAFVGIDAHGVIVDWNLAAERSFGWTREEALGRTLEELIIPPRYREAHHAGLAHLRATGEGRILNTRVELTALRRSGDEFPVELIVWRIQRGRASTFNAFIRDITEQTRALEAVRLAKEEAERANRAKSEFLSRMSHDLRTPLNAILGFAQLMEMDAPSADDADNARQILRGGRHLLDLINEVLDISSIEAGHLTLSPEPVPLDDVIRQVADLIRPLASARRITVDTDVPRTCASHVLADRQRLRQVLVNLVGNAVKYNHYGGAVRVYCEAGSVGTVRTSVTDTGGGIPPEKLGLLFQPFERLGAEATTIEGTGLGLSLAKGLVEAMGGTLGVLSEVNRGTTFWIDLPEAAAAEVRGDAESPVDAQSSARATAGTVLYIEDNTSNVRLLERVLLRRPGVRLLNASEGEAGIRLAREEDPDLILLDLHLPDMSGEDVLLRLCSDEATRGIPVGVLSADAMPGQADRLLATGAVAYLTKPLEIARILELIDDRLSAKGTTS